MKDNSTKRILNKTSNKKNINKKTSTKEAKYLTKYKTNYYLYYLHKKNKSFSKISEKDLFKIFEKIIEFVFDKFSKWLNIIGPLFVNAFLCFFFLGYHSFLHNLIPYWSSYFYFSFKTKIFYYIFYIIICPLYSLFYFQVCLYYILTVIIKPGSIEDLRKSTKFKKKVNPYFCYKEIPNLNYILRIGNFNHQNKSKFPFCKICKEIKPLRTHHCSICKECHLRMDHHCPWVNNCIGLNNFRYFILFLSYLWIICIFNTILSVIPFFNLKRFDQNNELSFVTVIAMCGIAILGFFNLWYWSMTFFNKTSIEFWGGRLRTKYWLVKSYSMKTFKENLYFIFGSKNLLKILLFPSLKSLDVSGLEWSKIAAPSFEVKGIKNNLDLL